MAIQHRRGADVDFKPDRMKAGELALTTDGTRKMYAAFAPGDVKEVAFKEDIPEGGGGGGSTVTRFSVNYDEVVAAMSGAGVPYIYYYGSDVTLAENRVSIADLIEALKKGSVQLWFSVEDDGFSMEGMYTPMTYMNTGLPMINVMVTPNVGIGFYTAEYTP